MMNNVPSPSSDSLTPDDMYYLPFVFSVISVLGSSVVLLTFASARQLRTLLLRPTHHNVGVANIYINLNLTTTSAYLFDCNDRNAEAVATFHESDCN